MNELTDEGVVKSGVMSDEEVESMILKDFIANSGLICIDDIYKLIIYIFQSINSRIKYLMSFLIHKRFSILYWEKFLILFL